MANMSRTCPNNHMKSRSLRTTRLFRLSSVDSLQNLTNNQILKDLDVGLWQRRLQIKVLALNTDQMNHDCSRYFEYKYFGQKKTRTSCFGPWNTWSTGPSFSLHQELKVSKDFFSWNGWVQIQPSGWLIEHENPPVWDTPNTYVVGSSHVFHCFYLNIKSLGYCVGIEYSALRVLHTPIVVMLGGYIEQRHTTLPETPSGQRGQRHLTEGRLIRKNTTLTSKTVFTTDGCFLETETKLNPRGVYDNHCCVQI